MKLTTLEAYIRDNIEENDKFYNESFCNLIMDYMSMRDLREQDLYFLEKNGYSLADFDDDK